MFAQSNNEPGACQPSSPQYLPTDYPAPIFSPVEPPCLPSQPYSVASVFEQSMQSHPSSLGACLTLAVPPPSCQHRLRRCRTVSAHSDCRLQSSPTPLLNSQRCQATFRLFEPLNIERRSGLLGGRALTCQDQRIPPITLRRFDRGQRASEVVVRARRGRSVRRALMCRSRGQLSIAPDRSSCGD